MNNMLSTIIAHKQAEVTRKRKTRPQSSFEYECSNEPRPFTSILIDKALSKHPAVIAEVKKASPSKGVIRHDFDPHAIAQSYQTGGATCLSVLTDEYFFKGNDSYIAIAKKACLLPVLRKDFIVDEYQIHEAKAIGADAILLIVAILDDQQLKDFTQLANELKLGILVESHSATELSRAIELDTPLIGINNRNLDTFKTDLQTTIDLISIVPKDKIVITESGINDAYDIKRMQQHGVNCFLIGESLMREDSPGDKLAQLISH